MFTELYEDQASKRAQVLNAILDSPSRRKLIIAGPGTGKTFTFGEIFRRTAGGSNLALTFITKLVHDLELDIGEYAQVKTFHAYCRNLLQDRDGGIRLAPYLTQIVREDADHLQLGLSSFRRAFQTLDEDSPEVEFFLERSTYYQSVSFDDAVYRVVRDVRARRLELPTYTQIVIDEFQDFNPLEIALVDELQALSPILIVGDDDQAVFSIRQSSPDYLRQRFHSGQYDIFTLPFCSRSPQCVVEATNCFIEAVLEKGGFGGRLPKPFVPLLEGHEELNRRYPKMVAVRTTNTTGMSSLIKQAIGSIPAEDIEDAHNKNYPCVLIVGGRQYLTPIYTALSKQFSNVTFTQGEDYTYRLVDGYELLLDDDDSNLGWRILAGLDPSLDEIPAVIQSSLGGASIRSKLPNEFVAMHLSILEQLGKKSLESVDQATLQQVLDSEYLQVIEHFFGQAQEVVPVIPLAGPSIRLCSFEGCKGLSAGHVFIVGLNHGSMPKIRPDGKIDDVEYAKFIVAMTRTRKLLYLLSSKWEDAPIGPPFITSEFASMIPPEFMTDFGDVRSRDIGAVIEGIFP